MFVCSSIKTQEPLDRLAQSLIGELNRIIFMGLKYIYIYIDIYLIYINTKVRKDEKVKIIKVELNSASN